MFANTGYEVYETTNREVKEEDLHEEEQRVRDESLLDVRELLEEVKNRYYELERRLHNDTLEEKKRASKLFVAVFSKCTGPLRREGAERALRELVVKGHDIEHLHDGGADETNPPPPPKEEYSDERLEQALAAYLNDCR